MNFTFWFFVAAAMLFGLSLYFFYKGNYLVGSALLIVSISTAVGVVIWKRRRQTAIKQFPDAKVIETEEKEQEQEQQEEPEQEEEEQEQEQEEDFSSLEARYNKRQQQINLKKARRARRRSTHLANLEKAKEQIDVSYTPDSYDYGKRLRDALDERTALIQRLQASLGQKHDLSNLN